MEPRLSRRDMLKLALAGTGYFILGPDGSVSWADGDSLPASPFTTPFVDELPLPGLAVPLLNPITDVPREYINRWIDTNTDFVKIASEERLVQFHRDLPLTPIWG